MEAPYQWLHLPQSQGWYMHLPKKGLVPSPSAITSTIVEHILPLRLTITRVFFRAVFNTDGSRAAFGAQWSPAFGPNGGTCSNSKPARDALQEELRPLRKSYKEAWKVQGKRKNYQYTDIFLLVIIKVLMTGRI